VDSAKFLGRLPGSTQRRIAGLDCARSIFVSHRDEYSRLDQGLLRRRARLPRAWPSGIAPNMTEVRNAGVGWQEFAKQLASALSLLAATLTVAGFLAARSAINSLGLPAHAQISVDAYLQYGGRFVVGFTSHMLLIGLALYALVLLGRLARRLGLGPVKPGPRLLALGIAVVAAVGLGLELLLVDTVASGSDGDLAMLMAIEALATLALLMLVRLSRVAGAPGSPAGVPLPELSLLWLMVGVQWMLLPMCFGRVSIAPREFPQVSLESTPGSVRTGQLVYRDDSDYYLRFSGELVQVARSSVQQVRYVRTASTPPSTPP
jgi:hypothetical protein